MEERPDVGEGLLGQRLGGDAQRVAREETRFEFTPLPIFQFVEGDFRGVELLTLYGHGMVVNPHREVIRRSGRLLKQFARA